jgi:N-acetylglucosaminyldiphosphoundecaprenol N-acetyl-beta-D-mannosaminyltransferase
LCISRSRSIFGFNVSALTLDETAEYLLNLNCTKNFVREDLNAFKICLANRDKNVKKSLVNAEIINLDGMSTVFAMRLLHGLKFPRVTGCDLFIELIARCANYNKTAYCLGSSPDNVRKLVSIISEKYSPKVIAGYRDGYFSEEDWDLIILDIENCKPNFLFIGTPSPQKEIFLNYARHKINHPMILMGVGGTFDVVTGKVKRAPLWMQKWGLEWLYRVIQEPRRMWKRYLVTNSKFAWMLAKAKVAQWLGRHK